MTLVQMVLQEAMLDDPIHFEDRADNLQLPEFLPNGVFNGSTDSGMSARAYIASLAATHGWPLHGIFMSGQAQQPHFILHVSDFPVSVELEPTEGLKVQMEAALERWYKYENPTQVTFRRQSNEVLVDVPYQLPLTDDRIAFELRSGGGVMPNGLSVDTLYWVVNSDVGTRRFQVSLTQGGAVETFNSDGVPPCYLSYEEEFGADIRQLWVGFHAYTYKGPANDYAPKTDYTMRVNNYGPLVGQWWIKD